MQIAIAAERLAGETRVAATPETVKKLVAMGHAVVVEQGAGLAAALPDAAFAEAGATLAASRAAVLAQGDIVLTVRPLPDDAIAELKDGAVLIGQLAPYQNTTFPALAAKKVSAFAMELLPRTTRAQSMDVLSSQASVAGYKAVLIAAEAAPKFFPMLTTAAGTRARAASWTSTTRQPASAGAAATASRPRRTESWRSAPPGTSRHGIGASARASANAFSSPGATTTTASVHPPAAS